MSPSGIGFRPFSIPSALLVSLFLLSPACSTPDSTGLQETEPLEKQVQAYYFGAGKDVDAFLVALSVPTAIFLIIREDQELS